MKIYVDKVYAWLSTLFVFSQNSLHLSLFSFFTRFQVQHLQKHFSDNFHFVFFSLCIVSTFQYDGNFADKVFHLENCRFVMNRGFSVDPGDMKNYELLAADSSFDLGPRCEENCVMGADSKEMSIHFNSSLLWWGRLRQASSPHHQIGFGFVSDGICICICIGICICQTQEIYKY